AATGPCGGLAVVCNANEGSAACNRRRDCTAAVQRQPAMRLIYVASWGPSVSCGPPICIEVEKWLWPGSQSNSGQWPVTAVRASNTAASWRWNSGGSNWLMVNRQGTLVRASATTVERDAYWPTSAPKYASCMGSTWNASG